MISPELSTKIQNWRQKSNAGTLSIDEMREAIAALRMGRANAANTTKTTRAKVPASVDDLLTELMEKFDESL